MDVKSGKQLTAEEKLQLQEMIATAKTGEKLNGHDLERAEVVFTHPEALRNNATWIKEMWDKEHHHFAVRWFDQDGAMHVFASHRRQELEAAIARTL